MTGVWKPAVAVALAPLVVLCGLGALAATALVRTEGCGGAGGTVARLDAEQVANATTIVRVGADLRVPHRGWVIAVATAMQESRLHNLGFLGARNDHDSLGLFQQRPSQGWGTPEQLTDPVYAATEFYRALLRVPGWQQLPLTMAAQRVQRSAYPDAYAKHEHAATALVNHVAARLGLAVACASTFSWVLPLPAGSYRLSSGYGPRWGGFHHGADFAAPAGTPVYAAAAGLVTGAECTSPFCDQPGAVSASGRPLTPGCGWRIQILSRGAVATTYCHLRGLAVHAGQRVTAGQVIGWVGSTGNSTGAHLHFQVHRQAPPISNATTVDPLRFLRGVGVNP